MREALREGRRVYATAMTAYSAFWMTSMRAFHDMIDFVFLDVEHVAEDRRTLSWACQAYAAAGIAPVVRIPEPDPYEACKALDGGAEGIIVPYTETVDQVRRAVTAVRLQPLKGARAEQASEDPSTMEPALREYLSKRNDHRLCILNIESVPAIENLEKIVAVPGVDAVLIGPHDLSCSLGIPEQYDHPRFDEAVRTIIRIARQHHIGAGIHFWQSLEQELDWIKAGANLVVHSSDLYTVRTGLRKEIQQLRASLGDMRA